MATQLTCTECNGYKIAENLTQDLQLPIPQSNLFKEEEDPTNAGKEPEKIPLVNFKNCLDSFQTEFVSLNCPKCKKSCNFKKTIYLKTWPKYVLVTMSRILLDGWVPKKDISEILFDSDIQDFSRFKLPQLDPSGKLDGIFIYWTLEWLNLTEEVQDEGPQVSQEAVDQLTMMGFNVNRAKRALIEKGKFLFLF